jgi:acetyl esterase/lipase
MTLYAWHELYGFSLQDAVLPADVGDVERIGQTCVDDLMGDLEDLEAERPLGHKFLKLDPARDPPWAKVAADNVPGGERIGAPVFVAQGLSDTVVDPPVTEEFVRILCAKGTPVRFVRFPGADHMAIPTRSAADAVEWIARRFAGEAAPSDCAR